MNSKTSLLLIVILRRPKDTLEVDHELEQWIIFLKVLKSKLNVFVVRWLLASLGDIKVVCSSLKFWEQESISEYTSFHDEAQAGFVNPAFVMFVVRKRSRDADDILVIRRKLLRIEPVNQDVEYLRVDVLQSDAFSCLFPTSIEGRAKVLRMVTDEVFVDVVGLLFRPNCDSDDLSECSSTAQS